MAVDQRPWYSDRCPDCIPSHIAPPLLVRRSENGKGVTVDYLCPAGHAWSTNWAWWTNKPHSTDDQAA